MKTESEGYYHIYNRGNNRNLIFFENSDYEYFLARFAKYVSPHCNVFAYSLMPNHYHFFLKINRKREFDLGMKNFLISYVKSINKKYNRVGGLFQGTYKVKKINSESYFTRMITYIHQNPLKAMLAGKLEDYPHSSYPIYLYSIPSFLTTQPVIQWFGDLEGFILAHQKCWRD